ncbi:DEAD/DEAH box helicase [Brucepastera parasyntrophica]|uniref:DEAD/DEAH box helicase family protein n=1 Tax=Brucepastera parasyntrophica TaxID=2880008 RepID=UPI00210EE66C|nr:DEAD/DEAH box helicase [Brucepastera parasyntrophica]ULQ59720.1 DEAD/DEAH box helicase [Brucepastera parasyntrophica]
MNSFSSLPILPEIYEALAAKSITEPTEVQKMVIPSILSGENVVFQSETGTGKTLCFLIPAFMRSLGDGKKAPQILIAAPTNELASQIKTEAVNLASASGLPVSSALLIGGAPLKRQFDLLKQKPSILIGGPARLLELIRLKKIPTQSLSMIILDEADRMLAPEMRDILRDLLNEMPSVAQYIACSATMTKYHLTLLKK